jgi:DNA-binding transcriptional regulator YiaG
MKMMPIPDRDEPKWVSSAEKTAKRKWFGPAVKLMRKRLGLSQSQLARKIGRNVDAGTVSRWERGKLRPHPWKRRKLADLAAEGGMLDLAKMFEDGNPHWRIGLSLAAKTDPVSSDDIEMANFSRFLTLLEICAVNAFAGQYSTEEAHTAMRTLKSTVEKFVTFLVSEAEGGESIFFFDDFQRSVWMDVLKEQGVEPHLEPTKGSGSSGGRDPGKGTESE